METTENKKEETYVVSTYIPEIKKSYVRISIKIDMPLTESSYNTIIGHACLDRRALIVLRKTRVSAA